MQANGFATVLAAVARAIAGRQPEPPAGEMDSQPARAGDGSPSRPADDVWAACRGTPDARRQMRLAGWLWRTGVRDPRAVVFLLEEGVRRGVREPYAYFTPGGTGRTAALQAYSRACAREGCRNA